ncbi:hypothetical protein LCGC14_0680320 [marine sediment metagenome]|uniref:Uncharacterized protein n=1 Tax=marine sediment metagenome TaxID=412755 RepID=A0A0F9QTB9_9ZZZZ
MEKRMKSYLNVLSQRRALYKLRAENLVNDKSLVTTAILFDNLRDEIDTIITEISALVKLEEGSGDGNKDVSR